ncbi:hypothetical protein H9651_06220 [Microbacterium sp. Sa4CUA7]|uniref:Uncharacterized protein n=1 Tax=Microbacterium pullorum TaxID=2762236 RepID=A0ABR8S163_9MICO|nr:DUF6541 family protein [Microbacterium pullorum]MBD7957226.1 hypothetical protein [Microbacterium pullorum]
MSYVAFVPAVVVCALVLAVPGLVLGVALRLRGLWLAAAAAPLGLTALAAAAIAAPALGIPWGPLPVLAVTALAAVVIAVFVAVVPATRQARTGGRSDWWPVVVAVLIGGALVAFQLVRVTGSPEAFSQSYDNVFHLNAVRWVIDTESASPFTLGRMTSPEGALGFYPSAWHGLTALVVELTGVSIPVAINAVSFVAACAIWPLGAVLLTRTLFGSRPVLTVAAGVFAAAFPTFPLLLLNYGVLYPMFLSYAVLPVAVAGLVRLVGVVRPRDGLGRWAALLVLVGVVPGMSVAHPGGLVSLLAFSVPVVVVAAVQAFRSGLGRARAWLLSGALAVYAVLGFIALGIVRPPADQIYWPIAESIGQAVGEVLTASVYFMPVATVVAVFSVVGIVAAVRRRDALAWTALGLWLMAGVLYVIVAASTSELLRLMITGPWYNNIPRLAALYPLATLPLAALGVQSTWDAAKRAWERRREPLPRPAVAAVAVVAAAALAVGTQGSAIRDAMDQAKSVYAISDESWMLTPDEIEMFRVVADTVPEDELVAGSPWTGAGLAYAFAGRPVLMPHLLMDVDPDMRLFLEGFDSAAADDPACEAAERLDVRWILDFGDQQINNQQEVYEGLDALDESENVELVERIGDTALYRVVGCGVS